MRAWLIDAPGELRLREVDTPEPGSHEIRVRVEGIGINRADLLQVKGLYPAPAGTDQRVPGLEYAGVVDAVGPGVRQRKVGERVMGLVPGCAYAEAVVVHELEAIPVPAGLDGVQAAAVPEAFLTAYRALFLVGGLQPGQSCLIRPASAGIGLAAVQLAVALGARPLGSSRDPDRLTAAKAMGLAGAVEENERLDEQVRALTDGHGVAVVLDMVGGELDRALAALRDEGTLALIGLLGGREGKVNFGALLQRRLSVRGMTMRSLPLDGRIQMARLFSDRLAPLFDSARLKPFLAADYGFAEALQAHADMAAGRFSGKLVLRVG